MVLQCHGSGKAYNSQSLHTMTRFRCIVIRLGLMLHTEQGFTRTSRLFLVCVFYEGMVIESPTNVIVLHCALDMFDNLYPIGYIAVPREFPEAQSELLGRRIGRS